MRATRSRATLRRHRLGPHPIVRHYLERMDFRGIVRDCLGSGLREGLDHAEVLSVLVHNVLVSRGPMYGIREWARTIEPSALGLTSVQVNGLNDDRIARALDALASERARNVFFRLALRVLKDFRLHVPRVHFDTTTVTLHGQYESSVSEPRITHGHNKDHRPDLKQLLFGLDVTPDGAVPLLHHVWSGNRTDDSVHVRNADDLRALLGTSDFVYVADSKLCTTANLAHLRAHGAQFVTVLPRTRKEDRQFRNQLRAGDPVVRWRKFHSVPSSRRRGDPPDVYSSTDAGPQTTAEGYRIVWVRSSQKAALDAIAREERIRRAEIELRELAAKVGTRRLRTRGAVERRATEVLAAHKVRSFLEPRVVATPHVSRRYLRAGRPRPGDPVREVRTTRLTLHTTRNRDTIRQEGRTDGVFPLVTSLERAAKREVLEIYKYQPYLEKRFALTKSEYGVAPIFLKKPRRVVALLHVYFVAIMLSALLERQVRASMKAKRIKALPVLPENRPSPTPTTPRILERFADVAWHEVHEGERYLTFPVELDAKLNLLLDLADVPRTQYS